MMTTAKSACLPLLLLAALAAPAAAQQSTIEVQPLEPLDPGAGQGGEGVTVRSPESLDGAEEGGFVRLPAPGSDSGAEGDLFSEGFDEGAFGESDGTDDRAVAGERAAAPEGEVTEDGLWALEEDSSLGTRDQSGSGWMEPADPGAGFGAEGEEDTAALIEQGEDDEPRFLLAPPTGRGLFGPNRPRPLPETATVPAGSAELRQLDKMTGATRTLKMKAGEERRLGRLRVLLEGCHMPPEGGAQGSRAFLRIWDPLSDGEEPVFSGWMFAESAGLSALDHPRYDLWVLGCAPIEAADTKEGEEPDQG